MPNSEDQLEKGPGRGRRGTAPTSPGVGHHRGMVAVLQTENRVPCSHGREWAATGGLVVVEQTPRLSAEWPGLTFWSLYYLFIYFFIYLFIYFHVEVSRLRIKPTPWQGQCQILVLLPHQGPPGPLCSIARLFSPSKLWFPSHPQSRLLSLSTWLCCGITTEMILGTGFLRYLQEEEEVFHKCDFLWFSS